MPIESRRISVTCPVLAPHPALWHGPFSPRGRGQAGTGSRGAGLGCTGRTQAAPHGAAARAGPASSSASASVSPPASNPAWHLPRGDHAMTSSRCKAHQGTSAAVAARTREGGKIASRVLSGGEHVSRAAGALAAFQQVPYDITGPLTCHSSTVAVGSAAQVHAQLHPPAAVPTHGPEEPMAGGHARGLGAWRGYVCNGHLHSGF